MERVLDLYAKPYDPKRPVVCSDERPVQLLSRVRKPLPAAPGRPAKEDYEYRRNGTVNVFLAVEPLTGKRYVRATKRRCDVDWARHVKELLDVHYPDADCVRLVVDNLSTHKLASLYEAFSPEEALRLARRLDPHFTPRHGSWVNMAEVEISVLARQCLSGRIGDMATLRKELAAWEAPRNRAGTRINWQFTISDARRKLHHSYPKVKN